MPLTGANRKGRIDLHSFVESGGVAGGEGKGDDNVYGYINILMTVKLL